MRLSERVLQLEGAAIFALSTMQNALTVGLDHADKPNVRVLLREQFTDATARLEKALGLRDG